MRAATSPRGGSAIPLCIDLDGSLSASDSLHDALAVLLTTRPLTACRALLAAWRNRADCKRQIVASDALDYARLPWREEVLTLIQQVRREEPERPILLVTGADISVAEAVCAAHPGLFDGVLASDGIVNLKGETKARLLAERFGQGGFDYVGDAWADLPVWATARRAYSVAVSARLAERARARGIELESLVAAPPAIELVRAWFRALRPRQWLKNTLLWLAPLAAFVLDDVGNWLRLGWAFLAFSALASAVYLINDAADLDADRSHPIKQRRPMASGIISPLAALGLAVALSGLGLAIFASLSAWLFGLGLTYLVVCLFYNAWLKHRRWIDIAVLALLYDLRVIAGAWAVSIPVSGWLLVFASACFVSLGALKRALELKLRASRPGMDRKARRYTAEDVSVVQGLGRLSGWAAALTLAAYGLTHAATMGYARPQGLVLMAVFVALAFNRIWQTASVASQRVEQDDPIRHVVRDPWVWGYILLGTVVLVIARGY